jgi:dsDNA-binding SOS-regulon protein
MIGEQLKISNKNNLDAHEKMFDKIDELKTDIIKEIHISNGD